MKINLKKIILILIIILAICLRFFMLDRIPAGFIPEEVSTGWNAYSLLKTARDEWNTFLPLIFRETGGYKLVLNSYLIVPVMKIFGANEFSVRFPTSLAGVFAVILTYFLVEELFKKSSYGLFSSFFLAISPWHISMGRYAVDVNWGIPLFLCGLILFLKSKRSNLLLLLSGVSFALTYYTYFNYVVFTPLFLVLLFYLNRKTLWSGKRKKYVLLFVLIQILFFCPYLVNKNLLTRYFQATSVSNIGFVNRVNEHRHACLTFYPSAICHLFYNRPIAKTIELSRNYINHFSTTTFFLYGSQLGLSGMPERWGLFYLFEFPLILFGIYFLIRKKLFPKILAFWLFLFAIPSSLAGDGHIWRMMTLLPVFQIMAAVGVSELVKLKKKLLTAIVVLSIVFCTSQFLLDYTSYFPYTQGRYSYYGFRDLYRYLALVEKDYDRIIIAPEELGFEQLYIYYLFYMKPNPSYYQKGIDVDRKVGEQYWVHVDRIGKWHFFSKIKDIDFPLSDKTLLVTSGGFDTTDLPEENLKADLIKTIYHANKNPAFKVFSIK